MRHFSGGFIDLKQSQGSGVGKISEGESATGIQLPCDIFCPLACGGGCIRP
ncbi:hypothetical protein EPYR_00388 [Erwinia pyrifoliae DSM 12163]|nr:hypothetical protein EPYR_00388 [Erwinia pyrifoliae DSM 12163]